MNMGYDDNTLIYIEENDKIEASIAAKGFADNEVKNRAYINALGAELALKYLISENINVSNIYNMHSIKKILEETDISDIMLPNIHIDVRVVFDDNFIFIPKAHFEYNLVPDIYLVFNLAVDVTHVKFLGFFEPKLINKNNQNDKYYFIEKEKLNPPIDLKSYIQNYKGSTINTLSDTEMESSEKIMISMVDNDISEEDKKYLLKQLTKSADLRDKFIEYENFELLSFTAINDDTIQKREVKNSLETSFSAVELNDMAEVSDLNDLSDTSAQDNLETIDSSIEELSIEENILPSNNTDFMTSDLEDIPEIDDILSDNTVLENEINIDTDVQNTAPEEDKNKDESNILSDAAILGTAAALGAGAGTAAETVSEITDGIEIAKDSLDLIYNGLDLDIDNNQNNNSVEIKEPENISIEEEPNSLQQEAADLTKEFIEESDASLEIGNEFADLEINDELTIQEDNIAEPAAMDEIEPSGLENTNTIPENSEPEILSIDNIDTSNFEEIELPEEEIAEETISIDNVDTSAVENHSVDFINEIDNKISFDDIDTQETNIDEPADFELNDTIETMSFNNIDTTEMDNIETDENIIETEKLSFDDVDTSHMETPEIELDDDNIDNTMSFDDIETKDEIDVEPIQNEEIIDNEFLDDSMSFDEDDLEKIEMLNVSEPINEKSLENIDEIGAQKNESFGKNLLDGLSSENISSDISIESLETELDLPETNNLPNAEDISSSDLLAEIDDILNTSNAGENVDIPDADIPDTAIEDILGINSLDEIISETNKTQTPSIQKEIQSFDEIPQTQNSADDIVSLIDNIETNYINDITGNNTTSSLEETDENQEKLGVLFNDNDSDDDTEYEDEIASLADFEQEAMQENPDAFANVPGVALYKKTSSLNPQNKKVIVAAALIAVLASVSVFAMFKSKSSDAGIENLPAAGETETADNTPLMPTEEVPSKPLDEQSNVLTNAPDINSIDKKEVLKAKSSKELKSTAVSPKTKPVSSESYLSVQKLVWDVPDYLSYSPKMKSYLMTAGKSIKLSLSADLLLATEYAYSNQIKVNLKLGNDGAVQDAKVVTSSGSEQIDKIVLQSVKDTLNVVKPPSGEVKGPNFNLSLIIYL